VGKEGVKGLSSRAEVREKVRGEYRFSSLVKQKKKGQKLRCLLLRRKKKIIIFIFMM